ncbi:MAG: 7-carboxy-7-deazaguanine synthase QueE [Elusimicrobia bacterium]|nr:7-carboxy-7-deazaguanine synthase QueE [Elusimicrobiota bacterium]
MKFSKDSAHVVEIFSSLQGEGLYLGERQIFLRFGGCNLKCDYCDEPETIPLASGKRMTQEEVRSAILKLHLQRFHRSVSLTGGEPLLHVEFLEELIPWIHQQGLRAYLETNGTLPAALEKLKHHLHVIAADIKIPSSVRLDLWEKHREFLAVAPEKTFIKIVLTQTSKPEEVERAVAMIQSVSEEIPLVLQPATPVSSTLNPAERVQPMSDLLVWEIARKASRFLRKVKVIPQQHPVWNLS